MTTPRRVVVLLIDDDVGFSTEVADALEGYDLPTDVVHDWDSAIAAVDLTQPPVILLDQRLGRVDTLSRLRQLRELTTATIILLTGNSNEADRIIGLEIGADDFLQKPISTRELLARIRAHLRRAPATQRAEGRWQIVAKERRVYAPGGSAVPLTAAEFDLLFCLAQAMGEPVGRGVLTEQVFRRAYRDDDRSVDNLIYHVRQKMRDAGAGDIIRSARGRGYFLGTFPS